MTKQEYRKAFEEIIRAHNGAPGKMEGEWFIDSPLGKVRLWCADEFSSPWIAVRFDEFSTGKVYDSLGGCSFNGFSGKWNVDTSIPGGSISEKYEAVIREFRRRLEWLAAQPVAATI